MNHYYDPGENQRVVQARESFSGRLLTDRQFDEALAITGIIESEIKRSGAFKDKLGDYAYAFARTERFDAMKAETVLRDLFRERTGQTMNQMREDQAKRQENVSDDQRQRAYEQATAIADLMENGVKLSFNRAVAHQAQQLAQEMEVSDAFARGLMAEEFEAAEGRSLWDWGKELDEQIYRPQIEAEKQERKASRSPEGSQPGERRTRGAAERTSNQDTNRPRGRSSFRSRSGPQ